MSVFRVSTPALVLVLLTACGDSGGPGQATEIEGTWHARIDGGFGEPPGEPRLVCETEFDLEIVEFSPSPGTYSSQIPFPTHVACNNGFEGDWSYSGESFTVTLDGSQVVFRRSGHADTFMTAVVIGSRMTGRVHPLFIPDADFEATR